MFSSVARLLSKNILSQNTPVVIKNLNYSQRVGVALRNNKPRSNQPSVQSFTDSKNVRVIGGTGGDGCISFLRLWCNENAGPDGGDGGNGGHVVFQSTSDVKDLNHVTAVVKSDHGEKGMTKDCHGKNATHTVVKVPLGTILRNNAGKVVGDLSIEGMMFVAARGGAGGKGNHFFSSEKEQAPKIGEYGAPGEDTEYLVEIRSMAHIGFIGLPNAGKSTLLRAITRARPKVAPYPFTTLRPHIGIVQYDDYEQIAVADLPGLIPDSHKNKGLGIQFLKHAERCSALLFVVDMSCDNPWDHYHTLVYELTKFSAELASRPKIIVANKIDLPESIKNLEVIQQHVDVPVLPISAKVGTNVANLLKEIRTVYDTFQLKKEEEP